jgi:hypothetical protein
MNPIYIGRELSHVLNLPYFIILSLPTIGNVTRSTEPPTTASSTDVISTDEPTTNQPTSPRTTQAPPTTTDHKVLTYMPSTHPPSTSYFYPYDYETSDNQ